MKTTTLYILLISMLFLLLPACIQELDTSIQAGEEGTLEVVLRFSSSSSPGTRAATQSTAIPITSWANIRNLQVFLYENNATGIIRAATRINFSRPHSGSSYHLIWQDVPVGIYQLAIVANATIDNNILAYLAGTTTPWDEQSAIGQSIHNLQLVHRNATVPPDGSTSGITWYRQPAEIFTAYAAAPVTITAGQITSLPGTLTLKRDVSLMRVRVDKGNNTSVNFNASTPTHETYIRVQHLPQWLTISPTGGVATGNTLTTGSLVGGSGTETFRTSDPTTGYQHVSGTGTGTISDASYTLWNDIILLPNMARNTYNGTGTPPVPPQTERYGIVIAAHAPQGHLYANGTQVTQAAGQMVYWKGIINAGFFNNLIQEVNVKLTNGGFPDEPTVLEYGDLEISLFAPQAWDSAILEAEINM